MSNKLVIPEHELPGWMRSARQRFDWNIVIAALLSLVLAWPFLASEGIARTNDAERYVFRTADLAQALREGWLYPRWSAHAQYGYGAPIPNFEAPGAPYLAGLIEVLFTNSSSVAVRLVFVLGLLIAGTGAYLLARQRSEAGAALIAMMLYVYSPQIGLNGPHLSGDLALVLASGLLPWALWRADQLLRHGRTRDVALTALLQAALLLTEPRVWGVQLAIVAGLALLESAQQRRADRWLSILASVALGLGLSAFFWLPALAERDAVRWIHPAMARGLSDSPTALLQPAQLSDPAALVTPPQPSIGLVLLISAALSLPVLLFRLRDSRTHLYYLLCGTAVTVAGLSQWLPLPVSAGAASLCFALASSQLLLLRFGWRPALRRIVLGAAAAFILAFSAAVWRIPLRPDVPLTPSPLEQIRFEQQGYGIAVLPAKHPAPTTLARTLEPNALLLNGYLNNAPNRFGETLLDQSEASILENTTQSLLYLVRFHRPGKVTLLLAYDPGWQATLDGQQLELLRDPNGLLVIDLPPIRGSQLSLTMVEPPLRAATWFVALLSLLITVRLLLTQQEAIFDSSVRPLEKDELRILLVVLATSMAMILFLNSSLAPPDFQLKPGTGLHSMVRLGHRTDTGLEAMGYELSNALARPGDSLKIKLYWQALRFIPENYQVRLQIRDVERGQTIVMGDAHPPANYPTRRWQRNLYVVDTHQLTLPREIEPGRYIITVEVLRCQPDCETGQRLAFFNQQGQVPSTLLTLPQIITVIPE